jgi:hypothetical protein
MANDAIVERFRTEMDALGARFIVDTQCVRFRDPDLSAVLKLWHEHCGADGIPKRRELTPQVLRTFVKKVSIFERVAQPFGTYRYRARLTGQEFTLAYANMSGKFLDEILSPKYLLRWKKLGDLVLAWGGPVRYLTVTEAFSREHSVLEHFIAPLLDDGGKATQLLFVCNFERGRAWETVVAEEQKIAEASIGGLAREAAPRLGGE